MNFKNTYLAFIAFILAVVCPLSKSDVWVLVNDLPDADASVGKVIAKACREDGLSTHELCPANLKRQVLGKIQDDSLLILTDCGILPVESAPAIDEYLQKGGRLLSLGGTLFRKPMTMYDGKWLTKQDYLAKYAETSDGNLLRDYLKMSLQYWIRRTSTRQHKITAEIAKDPQKGLCLHMSISSVDDYELLFSPILSDVKLQKQDYIIFEAKGRKQTLRMSVVFEEMDGSIWADEIPLSKEWGQYVIPVKDFTLRSPNRFHEPIPNEGGRVLDTSKIKRFACGEIRRPDFSDFANHEFWISNISLCNRMQCEPEAWNIDFKHRELLYPGYLTYPCSDVRKITVSPNQKLLTGEKQFYVPDKIQAFHPRVRSIGWGKEHTHRWIPLLEATSQTGQYRGTIAALRFDRKLEHMWAGFAIDKSAFYLQKDAVRFIVKLTKRMLDGNFLWEGGSTQFTYFPEQDIRVGASAIINKLQKDLQVKLTVTDVINKKKIFEDFTKEPSQQLDELLGKAASFQKNSSYHVIASLITKEGILVDQFEHDFWIWQPNENLGWITAKKGEFYLADKLWHPYGVNYMPSSGIAREPEDSHAFEHWFSSEAYDPYVIDRDLSHIVDLGLNTVCVFIYNSDIDSWNFIDFLRRCENHNLHLDVSFRNVMPKLDFQVSMVKELIEKNQLAINRSVFLYDLSWEYRFQAGYYDFPDTIRDWDKWLTNKYTTLEAAVKAWGYQPEIEKASGLAMPPTHEQWYQSGKWNKMLGDYSVFLNTILNSRYSIARNYIRGIDPNHLVSFRMQFSGDPTFVYNPIVPYDFKGLVNAVDVMEPEAYGRIGPWEKVREGIFTNAYARMVAPELPVFWPEIGYSVCDTMTMESPLKLQEKGAVCYRDLLSMLLKGHANGVAFWWYPGGVRTIENSDYGIVNPDGTDRPITRVIREFAPKFKNMKSVPASEVWVCYPQNWKPGGIVGAYKEIKDEFWHNVDSKKVTGLKIK
ncbi:MAG: hypothetical protein A2Y10_10170 [Planctomycetes bacterium GWF2_41_51]|nr:MAG: hypothetical protein A2Y10_10170 [Planctomycetes bacterium GWF2_41_51]HBG27695.1 hypothetical protein [Phycisphaerales bacterium]